MKIEPGHVLDPLPAMAWTALPDGSIDFVNKRWLTYTGLHSDVALPWDWQAVIDPDDLPGQLDRWRSIVASGEPGDMEARVRRFDGKYRWLRSECSPMRDDTGRILGWYGVTTDIEDLRRAEAATGERERDFQSLIDSIPIQVAVTGPSGEVEDVNQPTLDYFGKTLEELKDWATSNVIHSNDIERALARQADALQKGDAFTVESRHRRADGVYRWFSVLGMPLRNSQGNILRWLYLLVDVEDRKRAEEALQESERNSRLIVDSIPAMAWSAGLDGKPDFVSRHFLDYLGLSIDEGFNWNWESVVHPDDLVQMVTVWQAVLVSGKPGETEARLRRYDGEYRWFLCRVNPLRDADGKIIKWYGANIDIDDNRRTEARLQRSEAFLAQAQKLTLTGSLWWNVSTGEITWSDESYRLMQYPKSVKPTLQLIMERVHPDDIDFVQQTVARSTSEGTNIDIEHRLLMPDGSVKHIHIVVQQVERDSAKGPQFIGAVTDITARKQVEERLRRSEAFLAQGQRLARMGNFSWHIATGEIIWSEQLYRIFEFEPGTVVTLDQIATRLPPEELPRMAEMTESAERGISNFEYQYRIVLPHGQVKHLHLTAHRVGCDADQVEYIGAVLDFTQRRHSEETLEKVRSELAQVSRIMSLGALTASIAHEVNQPLSGIVTNAGTCLRMLSATPPNIEIAKETARRTIRDGNRAADVITRLRSLFSNKTISREAVDLNEAAREVLALTARDLQTGGVVMRTEFTDGLPRVRGDRIQLQQVIMNLLRNASDAMRDIDDRPRRLRISTTTTENGDVKLTVQDVGIGLGADGPERIFQAFYTTKGDGMGIGLSVSRSIIESHGGRLWVEANDGPGTTLSFTVPDHAGDDPLILDDHAVQTSAIGSASGSVEIL